MTKANDQPASADAPLFDTVLAFFDDDGWPCTPMEGETILSVNFQGQNGRWMCYAQTREEQEQFVFYSVCPVNTPEASRPALAEFLTRANYGLIMGNFELDYRDGEARYKTSVDVEGSQLTSALVRQCVYSNVLMMDHYLPGILEVVFSGKTPEEALRGIEG